MHTDVHTNAYMSVIWIKRLILKPASKFSVGSVTELR